MSATLEERGHVVKKDWVIVDRITKLGFFHEGTELFHVSDRSGTGQFQFECPELLFG